MTETESLGPKNGKPDLTHHEIGLRGLLFALDAGARGRTASSRGRRVVRYNAGAPEFQDHGEMERTHVAIQQLVDRITGYERVLGLRSSMRRQG